MSVMEKQRLSAATFPAMFGVPIDVDATDAKNKVKTTSKDQSRSAASKTMGNANSHSMLKGDSNALLGWLLSDDDSAPQVQRPEPNQHIASKADAYSKLEVLLSTYQDTGRLDHAVENEATPVKATKTKASELGSIESLFDEHVVEPELEQPKRAIKPKKARRINVREASSDNGKVIAPSRVAPVNEASEEKAKSEPTPVKRLHELQEDEALAIAIGNPTIKVSANADEIDEANRLEAERIREALRARKRAKELALNTTAKNSVLYQKPKDMAGSLDIDISSLEQEIQQRLNSGQRRREEPSYKKHYGRR